MRFLPPTELEISYMVSTRAVVDDLYKYWFENKDRMNDEEYNLACAEYFKASNSWSRYWYSRKPFWMSHGMYCKYWDRKLIPSKKW